MAATSAQVRRYQLHRRICQRIGIPQSTLSHNMLQGTLSTPNPTTGNVVYTGPAPLATVITTDTPVWCVTQVVPVTARGRPGDETEAGRQSIPVTIAQIPAIDDSGNVVTISHDDRITDAAGIKYRIKDPVPTPDNSMWSFGLAKDL
jgi:hypothetical protein